MLGKPTASLSSGLLARKGHARPAMRPQGFVTMAPQPHEDLGWNDMGQDMGEELHPQLHAVVQPAPVEVTGPVPAPLVLQQRAELEEQIAPRPVIEAPEPVAEPEPEIEAEAAPQPLVQVRAPKPAPAPIVTTSTLARVASEAVAGKSKAAFTLRLDPDRHLRLRLASAVTNLSAQQLVTQALDAFLESLTEVDSLARQLDPRERKQ